MEVSFSELKQKEVINTADGKHLGKACDIAFTFPEGKVGGFTVTGCKGFRFNRQEIFIPLKSVMKIGEDAILVNLCENPPPPPPPNNGQNCQPAFPPSGSGQNCPPTFPPPKNGKDCPPFPPPQPKSRRSYDEYE